MPYNIWVPRANIMGNQLEHFPGKYGARHFVAGRQAARAGEVGAAAGSAIGYAASYGARRFGNWYYPSAKTTVRRNRYMPPQEKKKKRKKETCCRLVRGQKVCKPEFCSKNKKYWY